MLRFFLLGLVASLLGTHSAFASEEPVVASTESAGSFVRLDPALDALVPTDAVVEKVATGFIFIEGPVWVPGPQPRLLFSDIPANTVYSWSEEEGSLVFLHPVMPDDSDNGAGGGSNGLALDGEGRLILCEHGNRRVARMEIDGSRTTLAEHYNGKRLNSPNDIVFHATGAAFFTDPPYGFEEQDESPAKDLPYNGIYRLGADGTVKLLADGQLRPNGIGLSPDERTLYVANSGWPEEAIIMSYPVRDDLTLGEGEVFFDASELLGDTYTGTPDGLTLDRAGNIYATGPGGVLILDAHGKHLGTIALSEVAANVGWGDEGKTLYITASTSLYRVKLAATGLVYRAK